MLIQVAGTSGSGKSHLMRSFLDAARKSGKVRETPQGYFAAWPRRRDTVFIVGTYNVPTGGCDTVSDVKEIYQRITDAAASDCDVLFEGLFVMNQTRGPQLAEKFGKDLVVLQLTTSLATCLESINMRRAARGEGALENKKNTQDNYRRAINYCGTMRDAGARVIKISREEGLDKISELLGLEKLL